MAMAIVNRDQREAAFKVIYFGAPEAGKSTLLSLIHQSLPESGRGPLAMHDSAVDRTLSFDYVLPGGTGLEGCRTRFRIYTLPGAFVYPATWELLLRSADGIVFIADSRPEKLEETAAAKSALLDFLERQGDGDGSIPLAYQYNKRDLPDAVPSAHLDHVMNLSAATPRFETSAIQRFQLFEGLNAVAERILARQSGARAAAAGNAPAPGRRGQRRVIAELAA